MPAHVFAEQLLGKAWGVSVVEDVFFEPRLWFVARMEGGRAELLRSVHAREVRVPLPLRAFERLVASLKQGGVFELQDDLMVLDGGSMDICLKLPSEHRSGTFINPTGGEAVGVIERIFRASVPSLWWKCLWGRW